MPYSLISWYCEATTYPWHHKTQLRKDITRGHFGQGHFGHFRFRKRGHLLTIIKYIYFIIVAFLTASVFDFDQMTNDQMTRLSFVFRVYYPRKSWMDFTLTLPLVECLLGTLILNPGKSWMILSFPDLVDSLLLFSWCSWQSISWISWQFTRNVDTFTEKVEL